MDIENTSFLARGIEVSPALLHGIVVRSNKPDLNRLVGTETSGSKI